MPLPTASSELSAASASNAPGGSLTLETLAGVVDQISCNMDQLGCNMVAMQASLAGLPVPHTVVGDVGVDVGAGLHDGHLTYAVRGDLLRRSSSPDIRDVLRRPGRDTRLRRRYCVGHTGGPRGRQHFGHPDH